jgi:hypothetical protein
MKRWRLDAILRLVRTNKCRGIEHRVRPGCSQVVADAHSRIRAYVNIVAAWLKRDAEGAWRGDGTRRLRPTPPTVGTPPDPTVVRFEVGGGRRKDGVGISGSNRDPRNPGIRQ